mmetsp:Transcript_3257/g.13202  ORF Transcript_3257/g.13202 Transcript_3257/m.13202 type:complete len:492 (+) Transcript_3257:459-1934(+)
MLRGRALERLDDLAQRRSLGRCEPRVVRRGCEPAPQVVGRLGAVELVGVRHAQAKQYLARLGVGAQRARHGGDRLPVVVVLRLNCAKQPPRLRVARLREDGRLEREDGFGEHTRREELPADGQCVRAANVRVALGKFVVAHAAAQVSCLAGGPRELRHVLLVLLKKAVRDRRLAQRIGASLELLRPAFDTPRHHALLEFVRFAPHRARLLRPCEVLRPVGRGAAGVGAPALCQPSTEGALVGKLASPALAREVAPRRLGPLRPGLRRPRRAELLRPVGARARALGLLLAPGRVEIDLAARHFAHELQELRIAHARVRIARHGLHQPLRLRCVCARHVAPSRGRRPLLGRLLLRELIRPLLVHRHGHRRWWRAGCCELIGPASRLPGRRAGRNILVRPRAATVHLVDCRSLAEGLFHARRIGLLTRLSERGALVNTQRGEQSVYARVRRADSRASEYVASHDCRAVSDSPCLGRTERRRLASCGGRRCRRDE